MTHKIPPAMHRTIEELHREAHRKLARHYWWQCWAGLSRPVLSIILAALLVLAVVVVG